MVEAQLESGAEEQDSSQNGQKAEATKRARRRRIDIIALATALGGVVAAVYAGWSVHVAGQANLASEQQQLLTLATNIGEQFATQQSALNQATKGLTGSQKIIAQVDQSTGLAAQLSAEGQAAQVLIGTLHGNGVAGIEYIDVGRALENAGDNRAALAYYNDAVTAPPRDVVTIGTALRDAGYLEYSLGLTRAGHQDMMRAVAVFRGRQLYIPKYALANDIAQGYYGDADEELTSSTPPGCAAASADMAAGNRVLAPVGGISGAQSANIELFDTATLADKAHCHLQAG